MTKDVTLNCVCGRIVVAVETGGLEIRDVVVCKNISYECVCGMKFDFGLRLARHGSSTEPPVLQMPPEFKEGTLHPQSTYFSEPPAERWKERAEEAEGILSYNMALANATTRRAMNERNDIIRKLRERHSAAEIADMVGLTRQRVHQILNESAEEGAAASVNRTCSGDGS